MESAATRLSEGESGGEDPRAGGRGAAREPLGGRTRRTAVTDCTAACLNCVRSSIVRSSRRCWFVQRASKTTAPSTAAPFASM